MSELAPTLTSIQDKPAHLENHLAGRNRNHETEMILRCALSKSGRSELKRIRVDIEGDTVRLRGRVTSYYLKQMAQEAVRPLAIGLRIDNRVQVNFN